MRGSLLIAMLAAIGLSSSSTHADERRYGPIDSEIRRVETGGQWKDRDRSGRYRAVVRTHCSREHCYDDLFIEWLEFSWPADDTAGPSSKVTATKRIAEVGGLTNVSRLLFRVSAAETRLEVEHSSIDVEDKWILCLALGTPGKYTSRNGRCRPAG